MNEELKKYVEYQLKLARQLGDLVFKHNAYGAVNWELIREKDNVAYCAEGERLWDDYYEPEFDRAYWE